MNAPSRKPGSKPPTPVAPEALVKELRAYLHLVTTAGQVGGKKALQALPGSRMAVYCRALAEMPDNMLAGELAAPIRAILEQVNRVARGNQAILAKGGAVNGVLPAERERILAQLDLALAQVMRDLPLQARQRANATQCVELLGETIGAMAMGNSTDATLAKQFNRPE